MAFFLKILPWIQIALSVLLIATVLLQQSAAGVGGALGGSDASATFHTRRGFERFLFVSTFVLATLFVLSGIGAIFF